MEEELQQEQPSPPLAQPGPQPQPQPQPQPRQQPLRGSVPSFGQVSSQGQSAQLTLTLNHTCTTSATTSDTIPHTVPTAVHSSLNLQFIIINCQFDLHLTQTVVYPLLQSLIHTSTHAEVAARTIRLNTNTTHRGLHFPHSSQAHTITRPAHQCLRLRVLFHLQRVDTDPTLDPISINPHHFLVCCTDPVSKIPTARTSNTSLERLSHLLGSRTLRSSQRARFSAPAELPLSIKQLWLLISPAGLTYSRPRDILQNLRFQVNKASLTRKIRPRNRLSAEV